MRLSRLTFPTGTLHLPSFDVSTTSSRNSDNISFKYLIWANTAWAFGLDFLRLFFLQGTLQGTAPMYFVAFLNLLLGGLYWWWTVAVPIPQLLNSGILFNRWSRTSAKTVLVTICFLSLVSSAAQPSCLMYSEIRNGICGNFSCKGIRPLCLDSPVDSGTGWRGYTFCDVDSPSLASFEASRSAHTSSSQSSAVFISCKSIITVLEPQCNTITGKHRVIACMTSSCCRSGATVSR